VLLHEQRGIGCFQEIKVSEQRQDGAGHESAIEIRPLTPEEIFQINGPLIVTFGSDQHANKKDIDGEEEINGEGGKVPELDQAKNFTTRTRTPRTINCDHDKAPSP